MLPVPFLVALLVAFGIDPPRTGIPAPDVGFRLLETLGGIVAVAAMSLGLGIWAATRASHDAVLTTRFRGRYVHASRLLTIVSLLVYGWIIHSVGWSRLVQRNWGLGGLGPIPDVLILLPFLIIQIMIWTGQFFAERALQARVLAIPGVRLDRYLVLRARQSLGLILPILLLFVVRRDVIARLWPAWEGDPLAALIEMAALGTLVLIVAPLFIRMAWPTRSLPDSPLRRRLERTAQRAGFRFADILIWETGGCVLNACVTGIIPGFRYVLLTDALVDTMTPVEVAAVFGHEIGHIAHRHLLYFGFFFAGSMGVLTLLADGFAGAIRWLRDVTSSPWWFTPEVAGYTEEVGVLLLLGLYFWGVFGYLSRRFERQADVFGSKIVSCDQPDCPPHRDHDRDEEIAATTTPAEMSKGCVGLPLCRTGLRTFSEALAIVSRCNGIDPMRRSWRHGSIASRIGFLQGLEDDPASERRFQREVSRLRIMLGTAMVLAMAAAAMGMFAA